MSAVSFPQRRGNCVNAKPDPALLCAVGERLAQVLASNRHLAENPTVNFHARRRIEAVIAGLLEALDRIDGDPDFEQTACEAHGRGFATDPSAEDAENFGEVTSYR
jgi:hypothetical protein